jgi:hypothetical protein
LLNFLAADDHGEREEFKLYLLMSEITREMQKLLLRTIVVKCALSKLARMGF